MSNITHAQLWEATVRIPGTYAETEEDEFIQFQCYSCSHYMPLEGPRGADWGVCACPDSPRAGLLCFEHMGCKQHPMSRIEP